VGPLRADGRRAVQGARVRRLLPQPLLILLFGGLETWRRWKRRKDPEEQRYHEVRPRTRAAVAAVYVGLAVLLALGMDLTFVDRDFGDV
jgi:hypothetical protein